ncbi:hypothetical protein Tco_0240307, partial [Tanacetum coccineum]
MMTVTTAFIRGETAAASKKKGKDGGPTGLSPLPECPKKSLRPKQESSTTTTHGNPGGEEKQRNKFCDFHNDKGYNTDECMQLKKQIEELVRA